MRATRTRRGSMAKPQRGATPSLMSNFLKYSAYYDLLYRDKDYAAEAVYVAETLRASATVHSILELGAGTGVHGRLLAGMGFDVRGIERSAEMVAIAKQRPAAAAGSFTCDIGDICTVELDRTFDAVIALFHVISYQTDNESLMAAFGVAARHLEPGGVFMFDVWHGPAVLTERPSERVKDVADNRRRVRRTARPELDTNASTVKVVYEMECQDLASGAAEVFGEDHLMRYLFPTEVDLLARSAGLRVVNSEEFLTGRVPSASTWGVSYVLRK